jgi:hypothetical protein
MLRNNGSYVYGEREGFPATKGARSENWVRCLQEGERCDLTRDGRMRSGGPRITGFSCFAIDIGGVKPVSSVDSEEPLPLSCKHEEGQRSHKGGCPDTWTSTTAEDVNVVSSREFCERWQSKFSL